MGSKWWEKKLSGFPVIPILLSLFFRSVSKRKIIFSWVLFYIIDYWWFILSDWWCDSFGGNKLEVNYSDRLFITFVTHARLQPFFLAISARFWYIPLFKHWSHISACSTRTFRFSSIVTLYLWFGSQTLCSGHKKWETPSSMFPIIRGLRLLGFRKPTFRFSLMNFLFRGLPSYTNSVNILTPRLRFAVTTMRGGGRDLNLRLVC